MTTQEILEGVLGREGWPKFTNIKQDRGGPTKGGITKRTLEQWRGRPCTIKELQNLKKAEALEILERRYVDSNGIRKVKDDLLRAHLTDDAVLSGPVLAVKDLQRALGVKRDGIIGPVTLGKIAGVGERETSRLLAIARTIRLARIVANDPTQLVFLVGWVTRSMEFIKEG
jgi:lysozyme family protein